MNIVLKKSKNLGWAQKVKRVALELLIIFSILVGLSNSFIIEEVKAEEKSNEVYGVINNNEDIKNFMNNYFNK